MTTSNATKTRVICGRLLCVFVCENLLERYWTVWFLLLSRTIEGEREEKERKGDEEED